MAAASRSGVPQPAARVAGSRSGVSQPAAHVPGDEVTFNIGTFNVGVGQPMLTARKSAQHFENLKRVISKAVESQDLSMFFACEVGGHKQGLPAAGIAAADMLADWFLMSTKPSQSRIICLFTNRGVCPRLPALFFSGLRRPRHFNCQAQHWSPSWPFANTTST